MRQDWSERGNPEAQARVQLSLSGARRGEVKRWDTGASGFVFTTCCGVWTVGGEGVVPPALTGSCFKLPWWSTSTPPPLSHTHTHTHTSCSCTLLCSHTACSQTWILTPAHAHRMHSLSCLFTLFCFHTCLLTHTLASTLCLTYAH